MTDINKHPILKQTYELCLAIEKLPPSKEQTDASLKASELLRALDVWVRLRADPKFPSRHQHRW